MQLSQRRAVAASSSHAPRANALPVVCPLRASHTAPLLPHQPALGSPARSHRRELLPPSPATIAGVPISVLTDSYKASHFLQYPAATKMVAVGGAPCNTRAHSHAIMCASVLPCPFTPPLPPSCISTVWGVPVWLQEGQGGHTHGVVWHAIPD